MTVSNLRKVRNSATPQLHIPPPFSRPISRRDDSCADQWDRDSGVKKGLSYLDIQLHLMRSVDLDWVLLVLPLHWTDTKLSRRPCLLQSTQHPVHQCENSKIRQNESW